MTIKTKVLIYGDSHSRAFRSANIAGYDIRLNAISSGSVLGLGKAASHLGIADTIRKDLRISGKPTCLIIKLGQVDIENIFLYKKYIAKDLKDLDSFLDKVFSSYEIFLDSIKNDINLSRVVVWGVTPPSPVDKFSGNAIGNYIHSMTFKLPLLDKNRFSNSLRTDKDFLDDLEYKKRINRSRKFNQRAKDLANKKGALYEEVFDKILTTKDEIKKHFEGKNYHIIGTDSSELSMPPDALVKSIFEKALERALSRI